MKNNQSSEMPSSMKSSSSSSTKSGKEYASTKDLSEYSLTPNQSIDNLIKMDHQVINRIYDKFKCAIDKKESEQWRNQLVYEIACHSVAEEIVLYPVIRDQLPNGKELFNTSMAEHKEVKDHLYKAQNLDAFSENFRVEVKLVMDNLIKHIEKEENDILPLIDLNISMEKRIELGNMFARRKLIVPTRPHPDAPVEPTTVESLIGMLTAPLDKFKDFFTSFPKKEVISEIKKEAQHGQMKVTTGTQQDKKEKGKKGAKSEETPIKEEVLPPKIDFSKDYIDQSCPIYVKVKHKKENFVIFTDEYKKSIEIKEEISKIKGIPLENIKLYYPNKRPIEDDTMNHDQQIKHNTLLFLCFKKDEWENINDIINYKVNDQFKYKIRMDTEEHEVKLDGGEILEQGCELHKCDSCNKVFAYQSSLIKHMRIHTGERPYLCNTDGCYQRFSQVSNLIRHRRIHSGVKPYTCPECNKSFSSSSNLKQHMNIHKSSLKRNKYVCFVNSCCKAYLYICTLKKHIMFAHKKSFDLLEEVYKDRNFFEIFKGLRRAKTEEIDPRLDFVNIKQPDLDRGRDRDIIELNIDDKQKNGKFNLFSVCSAKDASNSLVNLGLNLPNQINSQIKLENLQKLQGNLQNFSSFHDMQNLDNFTNLNNLNKFPGFGGGVNSTNTLNLNCNMTALLGTGTSGNMASSLPSFFSSLQNSSPGVAHSLITTYIAHINSQINTLYNLRNTLTVCRNIIDSQQLNCASNPSNIPYSLLNSMNLLNNNNNINVTNLQNTQNLQNFSESQSLLFNNINNNFNNFNNTQFTPYMDPISCLNQIQGSTGGVSNFTNISNNVKRQQE